MNEHIEGTQRVPGDAELRLALRGLRQDADPGTDLWPGIVARIAALPRQAPTAPPRRKPQWWWPLATAASLLLAVGVTSKMQPATLSPDASGTPIATTAAGGARQAPLVQREAEILTVQYRAALRELDPRAVPAGWQPGLEALDRSAADIRRALQRDPDSRLLLERLRDTYTRRLALSRRALYV
jgi:hypothetical protein